MARTQWRRPRRGAAPTQEHACASVTSSPRVELGWQRPRAHALLVVEHRDHQPGGVAEISSYVEQLVVAAGGWEVEHQLLLRLPQQIDRAVTDAGQREVARADALTHPALHVR